MKDTDYLKIDKEEFLKIYNWLIDTETPALVYKDAVYDLLYDALSIDEEFLDMIYGS